MAEYVPAGPWHDEPELWDRLVLGDVEVPGISKVEVSRANKWDEKKSKGSHGGEREYSGADLAKVKITIVYWTAEHHAELRDKVMPLVEPVPGKKKIDSIRLEHAVSIMRGVGAVTIDSVDGPSVSNGQGTIKIDATEYRAPETKNATGKAGGAGKSNPKAAGNCADMTLLYVTAAGNAEAAKRRRDQLGLQLQQQGYDGGLADQLIPDPQWAALKAQYDAADAEYQGYATNRDTLAVQMQAVCGASAAAPSSKLGNVQPTSSESP
jgi:hypothetical protein